MLFKNLQILVQKRGFPARARACERAARFYLKFNHQATGPNPMNLNLFYHKYDWIATA